MVEGKNQVLPAYEEYKRMIIVNFQLLNEYSAKIRISRNKAELKELLIHYKETYQVFYQCINDKNKLDNLDDNEKKRLKMCYENLKLITFGKVHKLTTICRTLIFKMGITKIEYKKDDFGF